MQTILERLQQIFSLNLIITWVSNLIPRLVIALIIFSIFYLSYRIVRGMLSHVAHQPGLQPSGAGFLLLSAKYAILIFGTILALEEIGFDVTSVIAGLGIVGISLGFAAKDALSNMIAGIFLLWDRPFIVGDLIEVSDEYGEVREITLRTTRIVTVDGKLISIPNSVLVNSKIKSYTMVPHLRLDIDVSIGVNEDIGIARDAILSLTRDARFLVQPSAQVVVTTLGDYFVGLQLKVWLDDTKMHIPVRAELRERIKNALDKAGVLMPYETIEVVKRRNTRQREVLRIRSRDGSYLLLVRS